MNATMLVLMVLAVLTGLEWRYRFRLLRGAAVLLSLVVLFFAQPSSTRAARWAMFAPPAQRTAELGSPLSEYESGVQTMRRAVEEDAAIGADARLLALGVLFWFACTPLALGRPSPAASKRALGLTESGVQA